jgi:cytoplasmic polyadenylation element-binding protein
MFYNINFKCCRYFCRQCWQIRHLTDAYLRNHKPLTRNSKTQTIVGIGPQTSSGSSPVSSFHNNSNNQRFSNIKMSGGMKNSLAGYGGK